MARLLSHSPALIIVKEVSYSGVVLWNSLPLNIRQSLSLNEFKSKLKNYDFDSAFVKQVFIISLYVVAIYNINLVR